MKFCVITKPGKDRGLERRAVRILKNLSQVIVKDPGKAEFCVLIGGDGTILYEQNGIRGPMLGVKTPGHVGHYLKCSTTVIGKSLKTLVEGRAGRDYFIHKLPRLEAMVNGRALKPKALNEVMLGPSRVWRMFEADVRISGKVSRERNSGMIVYTPSGSHGFASSLGARKERFGVAPLAPYSGRIKRDRALGSSVGVKILSRGTELVIDGQDKFLRRLRKGDTVLIRKAEVPAKLVSFSRKF